MSAVIWSLSQRQLETLRNILTAADLGGALDADAPRYARMVVNSLRRRGMVRLWPDGQYRVTEYGCHVLAFVDRAQCLEAACEP